MPEEAKDNKINITEKLSSTTASDKFVEQKHDKFTERLYLVQAPMSAFLAAAMIAEGNTTLAAVFGAGAAILTINNLLDSRD